MKELTERQQAIVDLLWDGLKKSPKHSDRVLLPTGDKTELGLARTIERICDCHLLSQIGDMENALREHEQEGIAMLAQLEKMGMTAEQWEDLYSPLDNR